MAKCKKGEIWDSKIKDCRTPSSDEKKTMIKYKQDSSVAKELGTYAGIASGIAAGSVTKNKKASMALPIVGALVGRYKAKKKYDKKVKDSGLKVPSRKKK